jgi:DNA polymerase I-like protein with 3'-5' exonuclease and polymerase domains
MDFTKYKVIDYETTKLRCYDGAQIFSYCIGHHDGTVDVRRLDGKDGIRNRKLLVDFWQDTSIRKIIHNSKYELSMNYVEGIDVPSGTEIHDTMFMSQLLRNLAPSHALDYLCWELRDPARYRYGKQEFNSKELDSLVKGEGKRLGSYQLIDKELMHVYQVADGQRPMLLFQLWFEKFLTDPLLYSDYRNEVALAITTQAIESYGVRIDVEACIQLVAWLEERLDANQNNVYKILGRFINLGSPKQLIRLLYGEMQLPIYSFTKSKQPCVDKDIIIQLRGE